MAPRKAVGGALVADQTGLQRGGLGYSFHPGHLVVDQAPELAVARIVGMTLDWTEDALNGTEWCSACDARRR